MGCFSACFNSICHLLSFLPFYCSRTHKTTDNQTEKKEKLYQQHFQQQCWEQRQQYQQQEKVSCCKPESIKSGTCKSPFPFRPESLMVL